MSNYTSIIVGAVLPAFLWGVTAVFQKLSATAELGPGRYLMIFGAVIFFGGLSYSRIVGETSFTIQGATFAGLAGLSFALGTGLLSYALWRLNMPISKASPILATNVLVTVFIGAFLLGEISSLNGPRLLTGTILVLLGAIVVTSS